MHTRQPPAGHAEALATWLDRLTEDVGEHPRALAPLPVYATGRDDVAAGRLLGAAHLVLWRSLILDEEDRLFALDLAPPESEADAWGLGALTHGALVEALRAALPAAVEAGREGEELGVLTVPVPAFDALWLRGPGEDGLIPIVPVGDRVAARVRYDEAGVLEVLGPEARRHRDDELASEAQQA